MLSPEHTTDLKTAHLPADENHLSLRYLRMMEKWIPVGVDYFTEWPDRPNCGHFLGGVHWYGNETVGPAETFALASVSPEYDENTTGVSREDLRRMAIQGLRYLCFTHDTGPEDCVRPSVGLGRPENLGTKWGERGKGFFRESQCGHGIAGIARICLLLRDHIDDETWMMVARIHEDYAKRFGDMPPKSGVYLDTQMEENAWTSTGLASCYLFLERHESAGSWETIARRWMFSTCAAPQDAKDLGAVGVATARQLTSKTFTTLPDYWAENHGMVHPNYTGSGVRSIMNVGVQLELWGRDLPPELFWNRQRVYEGLKITTDGAGYPQAVQGMDWPYLPPVGSETPHAIASVFFNDPDAAALQLRGLRNAELRQQGNGGRMYDPDLAVKAHGPQDPLIMREINIRNVAHLYLFHRLFGPGSDPAPEVEVEKRLAGVRVFPHAGFAHHRHPHGQTSLAWRNAIMALPLTREGIYTIAPASGTWLGEPVVKDRPQSHRPVSAHVAESDDGFAAALVIDRCQESLRQQILFASLPDGRVLSFERFIALEDLVLESLDQGFLRITNEHFPLLTDAQEGNCRGVRTLYRPDGATDYKGWIGDAESDDIIDDLGRGWLNIDNRMGIHFSGTGRPVYHNRHYFKPYRAIADDLVLSRQRGEKTLGAGEIAGHLAALLIPEQHHAHTPDARLHILAGPEEGACLATDGFLTAANFAPARRACTFVLSRPRAMPVFAGAALEARGNRLSYRIALEGGCAVLLRAVLTLRTEAHVHVDAVPDGEVYITNLDSDDARVEMASMEGKTQTRTVAPGQTVRISIPE